jgi:transposase-like protein
MTTMTISKELLDELLSGVERPEDFLGDKGLMKELKVRLRERMLGAELTQHLGYEAHGEPDSQQTNRRNGASRKMLKGNDGAVPIDIPRDRDGSFEPELIPKGQTRIDGMDDKIIGLYAAGLSTRDIRAHLEEVYGLKVSADLISRVTDAVLEEVSDWQNRALEPMYPIVFLDALRVKIRDAESRQVKNKAVYVALGVTEEGEREVLGLVTPFRRSSACTYAQSGCGITPSPSLTLWGKRRVSRSTSPSSAASGQAKPARSARLRYSRRVVRAPQINWRPFPSSTCHSLEAARLLVFSALALSS